MIQLRGGAQTTDPRLGRIYQPDSRNAAFPLRAVVDGLRPQGRGWPLRIRLDQGQTGACTGFARAYDLAAQPAIAHGVDNNMAQALYRAAQRLDEWPGEEYEGSSVLGATKAAVEFGYIGEYRWAGEQGSSAISDIILALGHVGPVVIGTDWLTGMFRPKAGGLLAVEGDVAGGHSYLARGVILSSGTKHRRLGVGGEVRDEPLIYGPNSWGQRWGYGGEWAMWASDLERLLAGVSYPGEAAVTTKAFRK